MKKEYPWTISSRGKGGDGISTNPEGRENAVDAYLWMYAHRSHTQHEMSQIGNHATDLNYSRSVNTSGNKLSLLARSPNEFAFRDILKKK